jgi:agmatinase
MTEPNDYAFTAEGTGATTHDEYMYSGALSFCRRKYSRDLSTADAVVAGVPFDTAVTNRSGCRLGPRAIRAASVNLAWARAWPSAFDPFERLRVIDWGDLSWDHGYPADVPAAIEEGVARLIAGGAKALLLGGDHFLSYPSLKAHAARHGAPLALVQFDAHTDTWKDGPGRIDHGTMFRHAVLEGIVDPAASIQVGIRTTNDDPCGFEVYDAVKVHEEGWRAAAAAIRARVGDRPVYVTFDIDGLDPSQAPGTGTPVCGGLFTHQALSILRTMQGMAVIGADVVEVSPAYDHAEITALAGATVALEMLCLFAAAPAPRSGS